MNNYIYIIFAFLLGSCSKKIISTENQPKAEIRTMEVDSFKIVDNGTFIDFYYFGNISCSQYKSRFEGVERSDSMIFINGYHLNRLADNCLKEKVFNGEKKAEPLFVEFLLSRKDKYLQYKPVRYRGEKVFLAMLELASSTKCLEDEYNTAVAEKPILAILNMIKSIENESDLNIWQRNTNLKEEIPFPTYDIVSCGPTLLGTHYRYLLIKSAWEKELIILKDFGEL